MKKQLLAASVMLLGIMCVNAQDTTMRNNQRTQNQKSGTNNNRMNNNTSTGNMSGSNMSSGMSGTSADMSGSGRYAAMGVQMGSLHKKDMKFAMLANSSNSLELQSSQLALQNASSQAVKDYAQMMIQHHTVAGQEMKQLLASKGAMIPDTVMLGRHRSRLEMLQTMQGADFDRAYIRLMVDAHEEDVDEFEDETTDAWDADLRAFATKMMPTLRTHYSRARELRRMNASGTMNNGTTNNMNNMNHNNHQ